MSLLGSSALAARAAFAAAPGSATEIEANYDGFDSACNQTTSFMSTWWSSAPYLWVVDYFGGNNRACSPNTNLTASWVSTVAAQGWDQLPLWVSYQAPYGCQVGGQTYGNYMSLNPSTASTQGSNSAYTAEQAAIGLGFAKGSIIYDDMEGYTTGGSCEAAVNSFVDGFCKQLQGDGWKCGFYGSSCASDPSAWYTLTNAPGQVWLAGGSSADSDWGIQCVSDTAVYPYDQRTHQYAFNLTKSYGGVYPHPNYDGDCSIGRDATGSEPYDESEFDSHYPGADLSESASPSGDATCTG